MTARKNHSSERKLPSAAGMSVPAPSVLAQLKEEFGADIKIRMASLLGDRVAVTASEKSRPQPDLHHRLDNFQVGESNLLAYRAVQELYKKGRPSPLVLVGSNGTGKTHLLRALASAMQESEVRPLLLGAIEMREQLRVALRRRRAAELKSMWRDYGALLIDDLHLIARAPVTLEELAHLVAFFLDEGRPVAVTAERQPVDFLHIPRLISRLRSGLTAVIGLPDLELKIEMTRRTALGADLPLDRAEAETLAAGAETFPQIVSLVSERRLSRSPSRSTSIHDVVRVTAEVFGITEQQLLGTSRRPEFAAARHAAMVLSLKHANATRAAIARFFGKKDHTSVVHAEKKLQDRMQSQTFRQSFLHAQRLLNRE